MKLSNAMMSFELTKTCILALLKFHSVMLYMLKLALSWLQMIENYIYIFNFYIQQLKADKLKNKTIQLKKGPLLCLKIIVICNCFFIIRSAHYFFIYVPITIHNQFRIHSYLWNRTVQLYRFEYCSVSHLVFTSSKAGWSKWWLI